MRVLLSAVAVVCLLPACAHEMPVGSYTRDSDTPWLDTPAMSTGLDRRDLDKMFASLASDLVGSPFYARAGQTTPAPTIAIAPLANETSEHIDTQLDALQSKIETTLVNHGAFDVVSRERQRELVHEIKNQQQDIFAPGEAVRYGGLIGARYVVVGKVYDAAERTLDMRRVQYMAFLQVIEVETGVVRWQGETDVTKAYVAEL
ncbi:MAG: penicillin-binding protein activator LpoB [Deltaproteobacteria bacterium HGW-Deltaproteobacteria-14]|jgi:hypothetical protein|nr:MAG: penicillin-binding protein activator LpoB [Deltaproteobacteria bacterium HGW-Deltaproteobacteria-14]